MSSALVKLIGFPATLIHGDPLVLDRWLWLRKRLRRLPPGSRIIDVGCGSGGFTIGASLYGHHALGLSWDERDQGLARERARICGAKTAEFQILDVRKMETRPDLHGQFDAAICCECIEHILDDQKLVSGIARTLKPGGLLWLTTPNYDYIPITPEDDGPFPPVETGWHVRRGYREARLRELAENADLRFEGCGFISGPISQKLKWLMLRIGRIRHELGWAAILPFRAIPPVFDPWLTELWNWPGYSITMDARKPPMSEPAAGGSSPHRATGPCP